MGTTAIGFNIFLGGSMAVGKELNACRRGIASRMIVGGEVGGWSPRGPTVNSERYDIVWLCLYMGVSKNREYPKMDGENNGRPYKNGWFGGTTIFGNIHI